MTELSRPTADASTPTPTPVTAPCDDLLPLNGSGPFTVDVKVDSNNVPWFALPSDPSTEYSCGVNWFPPKGVLSTTITFVFVLGGHPITHLTSNSLGLTFQPVSNQSQSTNPIPSTAHQYNFTIWTSPGGQSVRASVDPAIIVTPIDQPDEGERSTTA